jgi:glycosyltransferase involved in cell wall biosynthesis
MKIAWFTPFSHKSAIGKYSRSITNELNKNCQVDLWVPRDNNLLPTTLGVFQFRSVAEIGNKLNGYDFIVYNMGDHYDFHKDIYEVSRKERGIIVLHDLIMHHFFYHYYLIDRKEPHLYVRDMELYYGDKGRSVATDIVRGNVMANWENEIMHYPFFEKAIERAKGVICHSAFLANKVKEIALAPVCTVKLPLCSYNAIPSLKLTRSDWDIPEDKLIALTVGHINPNKRIDKVIEILARHRSIASRLVYIVIGPYDHNPLFKEMSSLINKYGLQDTVKFLGYQTDDVLSSFMSGADIFVNLRFPVMEGGSASLVEEMCCGKPVVVSDAGHYSELPDDVVVKVGVDREGDDLARALKALVEDKELRTELGKRCRDFALDNFNVKIYSRLFLDFITSAKSCGPLLDLVDRVGQELFLMRVSKKLSVVDDVSNIIYKLFSTKQGQS